MFFNLSNSGVNMKISFARAAMPGTGVAVAAVTEGAKLNGLLTN